MGVTHSRRSVGELVFADYNPRFIKDEDFEDLKRSIKNDPVFFELRPVIVNVNPARKNVIIAGSMRVRAAKAIGMFEVPCVEVDAGTIEQEMAWNVKDNAHHGQWDDAKLTEMVTVNPKSFEFALPSSMIQKILSVNAPDFGAGTAEEQGALDQKAKVECPECGCSFTPSKA